MTKLSQLIDHTQLRPDATEADVQRLVQEAKRYGFASVCVNPRWVSLCARLLGGTGVKVCTVIGFPLGATTTATKVFETEEALRAGADEVDAVIDIADVKDHEGDAILQQLRALVRAAHPRALLKVILEVCLLTDDEITWASGLAKQAGVDFVKTSTGFSTGGATVHAVRLMRAAVGPDLGVKAAGGIHTLQQLHDLVDAGATRIGASAGVAILKEAAAHAH